MESFSGEAFASQVRRERRVQGGGDPVAALLASSGAVRVEGGAEGLHLRQIASQPFLEPAREPRWKAGLERRDVLQELGTDLLVLDRPPVLDTTQLPHRAREAASPGEEGIHGSASPVPLEAPADFPEEFLLEGGDPAQPLLNRPTRRIGPEVGEADQLPPRERVERAVDQDPESVLRRECHRWFVAGRPFLRQRGGAVFEEVHRELGHREVILTALRARLAGGLQHPSQGSGLGIFGGSAEGVGGDAVPVDPTPPHLPLEVDEGDADPPVKFLPRRLPVARAPSAPVVPEEVFRVVEEAGIEALQPQPGQRTVQLVLEELRVDAVPAPLRDLDHLGERIAPLLAAHRQVHVLPLDVPDLGNDNDLLPGDPARADQFLQNAADAPLARAVGVVGGGVDEIASLEERLLQGLPVLRSLVVDPVGAEPEGRDGESGFPQDPVGVGRGAFRGEAGGEVARGLRQGGGAHGAAPFLATQIPMMPPIRSCTSTGSNPAAVIRDARSRCPGKRVTVVKM